eukprot:jgi/Botrbrau1/12769/Bobra.0238s0008.1
MGSTAQSAAMSPGSRGSRGAQETRYGKAATDEKKTFVLSSNANCLNLQAVRQRAEDLRGSIDQTINALQLQPDRVTWSNTLDKFNVLNLQYSQLLEQLRPLMKSYAVHPKAVNQENAPILPIMLASKVLPEMEQEEAALIESCGSPESIPFTSLQTMIEYFNQGLDSVLVQDPTQPATTGMLDPKSQVRASLKAAINAATIKAGQSTNLQAPGDARRRAPSPEDNFLAAVLRGDGLPIAAPPTITLSP